MKVIDQMKLFFEPDSVALIGASRNTEEEALNIVKAIVEYGFRGKIFPVNPLADEILGIKEYPNIGDIPEEVDLAVINTKRELVPKLVDECTRKGIKAIVIITQGFADADKEGRLLQSEITKIAKSRGARILGPNTIGVVNAYKNFTTSFTGFEERGRLPLSGVSQTGMFLYTAFPNSPGGGPGPVGKAIDLGNTVDVDFPDVLEYLGEDRDTNLIALHIEGIRNGRKFLEIAGKVSKKKPIIALKVGRSNPGAKAAISHTGSIVGEDEVYDAVFRKCGIIRVEDMDELDDLSKSFLKLPLPKGNRIGIITHVGGMAVMAADAAYTHGLELAKLSPETIEKLKPWFPSWLSVKNPIDIWVPSLLHGYQKLYKLVLESFLADPNVDGIFCVIWSPCLLYTSPSPRDLSTTRMPSSA